MTKSPQTATDTSDSTTEARYYSCGFLADEPGDHLVLAQVPSTNSDAMHLVIRIVGPLPLTLDLMTPVRITRDWLIFRRSPSFGKCLLDDLSLEVFFEKLPGTVAA